MFSFVNPISLVWIAFLNSIDIITCTSICILCLYGKCLNIKYDMKWTKDLKILWDFVKIPFYSIDDLKKKKSNHVLFNMEFVGSYQTSLEISCYSINNLWKLYEIHCYSKVNNILKTICEKDLKRLYTTF